MVKDLKEKLKQGNMNNQKVSKFVLALDGSLSVKCMKNAPKLYIWKIKFVKSNICKNILVSLTAYINQVKLF